MALGGCRSGLTARCRLGVAPPTRVGEHVIVQIGCTDETELLGDRLPGPVTPTGSDDHRKLRKQRPCQPNRCAAHLGRIAMAPCRRIKPVVKVERAAPTEGPLRYPAEPDHLRFARESDGPETESDLAPFKLPPIDLG